MLGRVFLFFCVMTPCFAQDFSSYRVYKQLSNGVFNIFEVKVTSLIYKDIANAEAMLMIQRGGDAGSDKMLRCQLEVFRRSAAWPKGMEQYTCVDEVNSESEEVSPTRHFQFAPGITLRTTSVGHLTIWKNEQPKNIVEYQLQAP